MHKKTVNSVCTFAFYLISIQLFIMLFLASLFQCEQSHLMREHEDVQERTILRYEERITELHSIIAELNKKIDQLQGTTIRYSSFLEILGLYKKGAEHDVNYTLNTI